MKNHTLKKNCFLLLLLLMFSCIPGCSFVPIVVSYAPEVQELREGEREVGLGNYKKAEQIFTNIYESDTDQETKNTALYNLTCTRMLTAENINEFISAVELLDDWKEASRGVFFVENPNLIVEALKEQVKVLQREQARIEQKTLEADLIIVNQKKELETLQHQISELEAIDQQLQEKKKPL